MTNYNNYMSLYIFEVILSNFHLNNNELDDGNDKLFKIRPLIDILNEEFGFFYEESDKLSIDEEMIFLGKIKFKQFIKNKPVKYDIKCFLLTISYNYYCCENRIYTGIEEKQ